MAGWFKGEATAKKELEEKRKRGRAVTGSEMGSAEQGALKSLLKESQGPKESPDPFKPAEDEQKRRPFGKSISGLDPITRRQRKQRAAADKIVREA